MHKRSGQRLLFCSPVVGGLLAAIMLLATPVVAEAQTREQASPPASGSIDAATGKVLSQAIESLNAGNYAAAKVAISKLKLDTLSPYEKSKTEQVLASIAVGEEHFDAARKHLQAAIDAGGLNDIEINDVRYQTAQMFMAEDKWQQGAAALEQWFTNAETPNSAAYYLLAVAYYQLNQPKRALPPAEKAVAMTDQPQPSWVQLVLALYLQEEQYGKAVPLLKQLIASNPNDKNSWQQLSSVYGQMEKFEQSLAVLQLAYNAGVLNEDAEVRRLADLQLYNAIPYRCATTLEEALQKKTVTGDAQLYEKYANCWIAAREFERATGPLQRAAEMSAKGDLFVRLGEVEIQRSHWPEAAVALQQAIRKGGLKDIANAHLLLGIAHFNDKQYQAAAESFTRARSAEKHRQMADGYLQLIKVQTD